jgi:hypothetical protein
MGYYFFDNLLHKKSLSGAFWQICMTSFMDCPKQGRTQNFLKGVLDPKKPKLFNTFVINRCQISFLDTNNGVQFYHFKNNRWKRGVLGSSTPPPLGTLLVPNGYHRYDNHRCLFFLKAFFVIILFHSQVAISICVLWVGFCTTNHYCWKTIQIKRNNAVLSQVSTKKDVCETSHQIACHGTIVGRKLVRTWQKRCLSHCESIQQSILPNFFGQKLKFSGPDFIFFQIFVNS